MQKQFSSTDRIEEKAETLWREIEPLYKQLHAYVRYRLARYYKSYKSRKSGLSFDEIIEDGAIPAHLLGKERKNFPKFQ